MTAAPRRRRRWRRRRTARRPPSPPSIRPARRRGRPTCTRTARYTRTEPRPRKTRRPAIIDRGAFCCTAGAPLLIVLRGWLCRVALAAELAVVDWSRIGRHHDAVGAEEPEEPPFGLARGPGARPIVE